MGRPRKLPSQGLPKRMYLKHGAWFYVHHDKRWERLGTDLAAAIKMANHFNAGASTLGTMAHWLDEWLLELKARVNAGTLSDRTREDYADAAETLKAFFGRMSPKSIEAKHITEYLKLGRDAGRAVRANREKAALSSCLSWMAANGHADLTGNVAKLVKRNKETKRARYISDAEYQRVYDLSPAAVRCWMELMYRTLQRPSDILRWTKSLITTEGGVRVLAFKQSKTGALMRIQVTESLQECFDAMAAERKSSTLYLISREDGRPYTESGLASMMRRAVVASGITDFAAYDCKSKGASDMYQAGTPLEQICALCGHDSVTTTEKYIKQHLQVIVKPNERLIEGAKKASKTGSSSQ